MPDSRPRARLPKLWHFALEHLLGLPVGAAIALWNAWHVLRSKRSRWAKVWSVVLAAACLSLLFVGVACHLVGFSANY